MPSTGFKLAIPAVKLIQTYAVVHTAVGIGAGLFTALILGNLERIPRIYLLTKAPVFLHSFHKLY
jgi:hypothetical protein